MFDEAIVEMSNGTLVRLPELSARLAVGEKGPVCTGCHLCLALPHRHLEHPTATHVGNAKSHELLPRQC